MPKIIKVGCCGWAEAHQKYFRDFPVIEIQETFYQPGNLSKYEKWKKEAPNDFEFVLKSCQLITHRAKSPTYRKLKKKIPQSKRKNYGSFQPTQEVIEAWERMEEIAQTLKAKIILFQSPASFDCNPEHKNNLRKFFKKINRKDYILVWEPRKWPQKEIKEICKELDLIHCVDPFKEKSTFGKVNYFRLHGKPGYNLKYKYTGEDSLQLKKFCNRKINYVLFNNLNMLKDSQKFQNLIKKHG